MLVFANRLLLPVLAHGETGLTHPYKDSSGRLPWRSRLSLCVSTAGGAGEIPGQGTKTIHAEKYRQKKKN